jgi:hypothetical protein
MSNPVQFFRADDVGAPQLTNAMGSLIAVLDACLVNGYNPKAMADIVSIVSTGDVAKITFAAAHGYRELQTLAVTLPDPQYSGNFKVISSTTTEITFKLAAVPTNATVVPNASSTIKVKGAAWVKEFSETNKAAYRPALRTAERCYMAVDDSLAITMGCARVRGYETMVSASSGTNAFPTTVQQPISTIPKSSDAIAKNWYLVVDGDMLYFFVNPSTPVNNSYFSFVFGYPRSKMTIDDTFGCYISACSTSESSSYSGGITPDRLNAMTTVSGYFARAFTQIGAAIKSFMYGSGVCGFGNAQYEPFPSPADNSLNVSPVYLTQETYGVRSVLQGILQPLHKMPLGYNAYYKGLAEYPNQTILSIPLASSPAAPAGELHVVVEGNW